MSEEQSEKPLAPVLHDLIDNGWVCGSRLVDD